MKIQKIESSLPDAARSITFAFPSKAAGTANEIDYDIMLSKAANLQYERD